MKAKFNTLIIIFFLVHSLYAQVTLPALVGDNMVLQRETDLKIWGWAKNNEKVTVYFQKKKYYTKTNKNGKWSLTLPQYKAGGPYEMEIQGSNKIVLKNIMIGDVWLASGQSNMEWPLKNANNAEQEINTSQFPDIRLFKVHRKIGFTPEEHITSKGWQLCTPKTVEDFSAVAYLFARNLYQDYTIPIGIIQSAWGGTTAETWTSIDGIKTLPAYKQDLEQVLQMNDKTYQSFNEARKNWNNGLGQIDRGIGKNSKPWYAMDMNTSDWSKMHQPGMWMSNPNLKGFTGTIWMKKEIELPISAEGKELHISFGDVVMQDSTYFNGKFIGTTTGFNKKRAYTVSGKNVQAGSNYIVSRVSGIPDEFGGIMGPDKEMYVTVDGEKTSLVGEWQYKTGPEISNRPEPGVYAHFNAVMPQNSTLLFNGMIAPLIPYKIKGVIWYQGESNADTMLEANNYYSLFPTLIKDWRKHWGYDFPFLFVQLAGYQPDDILPKDYPWARLRDAQFKTLSLPQTGMATAIDIGEENDIHPTNKQDVAKRLALVAKKVAYKEQIISSGPIFSDYNIENNKVRIHFSDVDSDLITKDKYGYVRGFAIAGADKKFVWAKGYIDGKDVILYNENIPEPKAVRYNWGNSPDGNLYNNEGLPALPFKTDEW